MNRRDFVIGTAAVAGIAAFGFKPVKAQQLPLSGYWKLGPLTYEGQIASAHRAFECDVTSRDTKWYEDATEYDMFVTVFETEDQAKEAFDASLELINEEIRKAKVTVSTRDDFSTDYTSDAEGVVLEVGEQAAAEFMFTDESNEHNQGGSVTYLRVQEGKVLHVWTAFGSFVRHELYQLANDHMKFDVLPLLTDAMVLELIPTQEDMPRNDDSAYPLFEFTMTKEEVIRS